MLHVEILRKGTSYQYRRDPNAPFDWHNNDANNALDDFMLYDNSSCLLQAKVQTVANLEGLDSGVHFHDTIRPGKFFLRAFVEPRAFKCQPHGVVGATTMRGDSILTDFILGDSTTGDNSSRWLMHDRKDHNGKDTRVAWSAGCIVHVDDSKLDEYNAILKKRGVQPGTLIPTELVDE